MAKRSRLANELRKCIVNGKYQPGHRLPVRTELARKFALSSVTVQRAVDQLVAEGFLETRRRGGTVVAHAPPHVGQYGLAFPHAPVGHGGWSNFDAALVCAAELVAGPNCQFSIYYSADEAHALSERKPIRTDLFGGRLAGLILGAAPSAFGSSDLFNQTYVPVVGVMSSPLSAKVPAVYPDYTSFWDFAAQHLTERGRRRVAVLALNAAMPEMMQRLDAAGVHAPEHLVQSPSLASPAPARAAQLLMLLPPSQRPDALIIADDNLVESATQGLAALGVRCPDDLDVVAHCNYPAPPRAAVPVQFVGFDAATILRTCVNILDQARRSENVPSLTLVPAQHLTPDRGELGETP